MTPKVPFVLLFALAATIGGCNRPADVEPARGADSHAAERAAETAHDDAVALSDRERAEFGIVVEAAGPGVLPVELAMPGEVRPDADHLAHIVPRYAGIATEVRRRIGDRVERGDVLAVIESDESLTTFEVRTLISGQVIARHVTLGEAVSRDQDLYVVADLERVWIDFTVHQRDLARVRAGQAATVLIGHDAVAIGTVDYVTPTVDETTRTATGRIVLANPDGRWRPGMFVTVRVVVARVEAAVVAPRSALFTHEGSTVVFAETAEGFVPRPVVPGRAAESAVEIVDGLAPGERIVTRGGFTIKAELEKGAFGDGHGH